MLAILLGCTGKAQVYPGETWTDRLDPQETGWNQAKRSAFRRFIEDSTNVTGLLIIHGGEVVFEYGDVKENSYIASCRKSILALLIGKYVQNNTISLDKSLEDLAIRDVQDLLAVEKKATLRDLISAKSGVYLSASNSGDFRRYAPHRGSVQPGTYWLYNNWDFNLAGYIFEQESKSNIYDELESQLALPLQMQDWDRSLQHKSGDISVSKFPAYHMWLSTRDMARIGLLMLRKGRWKGSQVIAEEWIGEIIKQRTSYIDAQKNVPVLKEDGLDLGYGYMWWLVENTKDARMKGAYSAQGALGQNITVYPASDVVLAFKTKSAYGRRNSIQTQMKLMKKAIQLYEPIL